MEKTLAADLQQYLEDPSAERFMHLRDTVSQLPEYAPYSGNLGKAHEYFAQSQFEEARHHLLSLIPSWLLNPSLHVMLGYAYRRLGEEQSARFEYALAAATLKGILSTGDGSEARPYLVLHTQDEYDVLDHLERRSQRQALVHKETERYDVQTCDDGSDVWFDVTVPLAQLERRMADMR